MEHIHEMFPAIAVDRDTLTSTDTSIIETPLAIQVLPQQVMKDQQAFRIDKALNNVSSVFSQIFKINNAI